MTNCWISEVPSKMVWIVEMVGVSLRKLSKHLGFVLHTFPTV
jgi:hypothetical protein